MNKNYLRLFFISLLLFLGCSSSSNSEIYIRVNQVGYIPSKVKTAIVFSSTSLEKAEFKVINLKSKQVVLKDKIANNLGAWGRYNFNYRIDFSGIRETGDYIIEVNKQKSPKFRISENAFNGIADSLIKFLQVQRCGPTNPLLHEVCHLYDSPNVVGDRNVKSIDVTGGWHDAGDYIKFLSTSALTTYILLFSYEFDKVKFSFDNNKNNVPDILEEARVGLDWLLRCNYAPEKLINHVGDMRDHEVGWRMPEDDKLKYERPAYSSLGKNIIGAYVAALSLGAKIWKETFYDDQFSSRLLKAAEQMYAVAGKSPDLDTNYTGMYKENNYLGKMALGAIELYHTTKRSTYLNEAMSFADKAGADYWWSFGDINSLAHYRIALVMPRFKNYILQNLTAFNNNKDSEIYNQATAFSWGTTNSLLGVALNAILWKRLNVSSEYDSLLVFQVDYVLGKNPWGVSFISNIGSQFSKHLHHQIGRIKRYLPGAISAGPAPKDVLKNYNIDRKDFRFSKFNSENVEYYDDYDDYITNEPTIVTNATGIFVFGNLVRK